MTMTAEDKQWVVDTLASAIGAALHQPQVPAPTEPEPAPSGVLAPGLAGLLVATQYLWAANDFAAQLGNRFRRCDVYDMLVYLVEMSMEAGEVWVQDSPGSWRWTKEALMTRSSEISHDMLTTEWPVLESHTQAMSTVDYGITERLANLLDLLLRKMSGAWQRQHADRDRSATGEPLSNGDCLRLCWDLLDFLTDHKLVPTDSGSAFMRVRAEVRSQYKALGEGSFGPYAAPGGSQPWSWAGG